MPQATQNITMIDLAKCIQGGGGAALRAIFEHVGRRIEAVEQREAGMEDRTGTVEQIAKSMDRIVNMAIERTRELEEHNLELQRKLARAAMTQMSRSILTFRVADLEGCFQ